MHLNFGLINFKIQTFQHKPGRHKLGKQLLSSIADNNKGDHTIYSRLAKYTIFSGLSLMWRKKL